MVNQDQFEELSQSLLQKMSHAEDVMSQLGSRIDNKQALITQLEAADVSLLPILDFARQLHSVILYL